MEAEAPGHRGTRGYGRAHRFGRRKRSRAAQDTRLRHRAPAPAPAAPRMRGPGKAVGPRYRGPARPSGGGAGVASPVPAAGTSFHILARGAPAGGPGVPQRRGPALPSVPRRAAARPGREEKIPRSLRPPGPPRTCKGDPSPGCGRAVGGSGKGKAAAARGACAAEGRAPRGPGSLASPSGDYSLARALGPRRCFSPRELPVSFEP